MTKIRRLIRWFLPLGYAVRLVKKYNTKYYASGEVNNIPICSMWETPYDGIFLVYSKEVRNRNIEHKIKQLQKEIDGLGGCLKE